MHEVAAEVRAVDHDHALDHPSVGEDGHDVAERGLHQESSVNDHRRTEQEQAAEAAKGEKAAHENHGQHAGNGPDGHQLPAHAGKLAEVHQAGEEDKPERRRQHQERAERIAAGQGAQPRRRPVRDERAGQMHREIEKTHDEGDDF